MSNIFYLSDNMIKYWTENKINLAVVTPWIMVKKQHIFTKIDTWEYQWVIIFIYPITWIEQE